MANDARGKYSLPINYSRKIHNKNTRKLMESRAK